MNEGNALLQQEFGGPQIARTEIGRTAAKITCEKQGICDGLRIAFLLRLFGCGLQNIRDSRHQIGSLLQVHFIKTFGDATHDVSSARTNSHGISRIGAACNLDMIEMRLVSEIWP
jgi:hypothetical protein